MLMTLTTGETINATGARESTTPPEDDLPRTVFNMYIVNLAITDISVAVTAMSFYATFLVLGYWPFGEFMCIVWMFFDYGMTFASVFTLLAISVDRYWSVRWIVHYRSMKTRRRAVVGIATTWITMLILTLPMIIVARNANSTPAKKEEKRNRRENQTLVTLRYILTAYILCWVPFYVVFDISAFCPEVLPDLLYTVTFWTSYMNSTINPIIYSSSNEDFRRAFREICRFRK
nr:hypothetical protein BaRGS_029344 [Batillaria attramentaria]